MATAQELQKNTEANNIANYGVNTLGQAPNIPIAQIIPTQPLNLGNQQPDNSASLLGTTNSSINYVNDLTTQSNNALAQVNTSQKDITGLMTSILGKTADTQAANESSGLNAATKQLSELNAQAQSLNREAQAIPIQVQQNALPGSTRGGNAPVNADMLRTNALKALSLAQQADIATANYTAAKDKAQQIIDLKYLPLEQELAIKRQQYEFNKDILTRVDAKRAEALQVALKKQEQDLETKKTNDKTIQDMFLTAQNNQAPQNIIDNANTVIKNGGTVLDVARTLGKYGGDYQKAELLKEQIKTERAQQSQIYANTRKINAEVNALNTPNGGKPPTDTQIQNAGYADRIKQANDIIDSNVDTFKNMSYIDFKLADSKSQLANTVLSPEKRQVAQAMRNFVTAKLRKESGAAISPTEFEDAKLQYFPALGDDTTTLANKKALRESVLNNLIQGSGSAYKTSTNTINNPFSTALGGTAPIPGTNIVQSVLPDGSLNFNIPKK